ncbi:hypothetical protein JTE90_027750 [Oedothorax gibbosus]|uniref:Farnesyl pyrophosphate synthase n=1 Tax=Oedothorax gibbosus TaxID=931172 RepID=A0AAV6V8A4_9ARAC|nr:hypothetical protein JTE90_027750 [Oedothorax gibbosus]
MFALSVKSKCISSTLIRSFSLLYRKKSCNLPLLKRNYFHGSWDYFSDAHLKQPKLDLDQCAEFNRRLESVPYYDLLNGGVERFRNCLVQEDNKFIADVVDWCSKVFDYNLQDGKKIRGLALLKTYCAYEHARGDGSFSAFDTEGWNSAVTLAWCVEMLQAFLLITDDVMDQSILRRGKPCWYTKSDVGLCAINDALMLNYGIFKVMEKQLGHLKCYNNLVHEFLQVTHKTVYGQSLDMLSNPLNKKPQFPKFTFERYQTLVEYKTTHYTFCLPVHLAMHLVGQSSTEEFSLTKDFCLKVGLYFQIQDDFLDCFGDPEVTGKLGNDIREGKLTWLAVTFLEHASPEMKKEFVDNYGAGTDASISKVMDLYRGSSISDKFEEFQQKLSSEIRLDIESMVDYEQGLFYNLFSQISKRDK